MKIGIYTFGDWTAGEATGKRVPPNQRMKELIEEMELADQVGLDVFGVGEHHRPEYLISAPAVVLAAGAARTSRLRLSSAVSVLSSDDPVRVFQQFATLDLISNGRAEIMAGRGSFIESFPLFGFDLDDYAELFEEKLQLLLRIRDSEEVSWTGKHRPALHAQRVYPRPVQEPLPVWIAIGGTPASAARAGRLGLPLALAILGGQPIRFRPLIEHYRSAATDAGFDAGRLPVSINVHGFIADDSQRAADEAFGPFTRVMNEIGRERGWGRMTRSDFEQLRADGALLVGNPEEVAARILEHHAIFGHQRTLIQLTVGTLPYASVMKAIELLGTRVAPLVRSEVARKTPAPLD